MDREIVEKVTIIVAFHFMKRRLKKTSHQYSRVSLQEAAIKNKETQRALTVISVPSNTLHQASVVQVSNIITEEFKNQPRRKTSISFIGAGHLDTATTPVVTLESV